MSKRDRIELERWRVQWNEHRRWFAEFPEVACVLDRMKAEVDGEPVTFIDAVRESIRANRRPTPEPQGEAVAIIGSAWTLVWFGHEPIADVARRHGLKIGDKLYTRPQPGEGGGEITDEMVERAYEAWRKAISADHVLNRDAIRAALTAALSKGGQGGGE